MTPGSAITNENGQVVLMHDHTVDRTTDGSGPVNSFTLDEIRKLDAGEGERVPTLDELVDLARGKVQLHVEQKDPSAVERVLRAVEEKQIREQVFLTCSETELLERIRGLEPTIRLGHIFGDPPADAIDRALHVRATRVSTHFAHLTREFVDQSHANGLEVVAWPPNNVEEQKYAIELGVDLICTDRPDILIATLQELGLRTP